MRKFIVLISLLFFLTGVDCMAQRYRDCYVHGHFCGTFFYRDSGMMLWYYDVYQSGEEYTAVRYDGYRCKYSDVMFADGVFWIKTDSQSSL